MMQKLMQNVRARADQQSWIELCQRVASQPGLTNDLASLVELLNLPLSCCLAVHKVLREGNWARAEQPKAYIKKAAMAQARKMHLSIPHRDDTSECGEPALVFMDGNKLDRATTHGRIERELDSENREHGTSRPKRQKGKHYTTAQFAPDEEVRSREIEAEESEDNPRLPSGYYIRNDPPDWYLRQVEEHNQSSDTERYIHVRPQFTPDWKKWAEKAGLDQWEQKVIEYRRNGVSRDIALSLQVDGKSRKALQAAWRRFDRTGVSRLRECAKKLREECPE